MADKAWTEMTPEEKRAVRLERWLNPGIPWASPEAEAHYKARVGRLTAAVNLEEPDRVPVSLTSGWWPAERAGMTPYEAMHDTAKAAQAWVDFNLEFQLDTMVTPVLQTTPAEVFETIDYRLYSWPGHGVAKEVGYQYNEKEWMLPEEYDHLISDPTDYLLRTYLPRTVGAFAALLALLLLVDAARRTPWRAPIREHSVWGLATVGIFLAQQMTVTMPGGMNRPRRNGQTKPKKRATAPSDFLSSRRSGRAPTATPATSSTWTRKTSSPRST